MTGVYSLLVSPVREKMKTHRNLAGIFEHVTLLLLVQISLAISAFTMIPELGRWIYIYFFAGQMIVAVLIPIILAFKGFSTSGVLRILHGIADPVLSYGALLLGVLIFQLPKDLALSSCVYRAKNDSSAFASCLKLTPFTRRYLVEKVQPIGEMTDHALAETFLIEKRYVFGALFLVVPVVIHVISRLRQKKLASYFVVILLCWKVVMGELFSLILIAFDVVDNAWVQTPLIVGTVAVLVGSNSLAMYPFFTFEEGETEDEGKTKAIGPEHKLQSLRPGFVQDKVALNRRTLGAMVYAAVVLNVLMFSIQFKLVGFEILPDRPLGIVNLVFTCLNVAIPSILAFVCALFCQRHFCRQSQSDQRSMPIPVRV